MERSPDPDGGELARLRARVAAQDQEILRLRDDLDAFASSASHDLNEPLRMIVSYLSLLSRRFKGKLGSEADEFIEFAVDGARRLQLIIAGLVTYARIGSRGLPPEPTDPGAVLQGVLDSLRGPIELTGARVVAAPLPAVHADGDQLAKLFRILLENALEYRSDEQPRIQVDAERDGDTICLAVKDNGAGFAMEYADRIFALCHRLHTQAEHPGSGIGLAIARRIVQRHGGRIWAESAPRQGATFRFTLPAAASS